MHYAFYDYVLIFSKGLAIPFLTSQQFDENLSYVYSYIWLIKILYNFISITLYYH